MNPWTRRCKLYWFNALVLHGIPAPPPSPSRHDYPPKAHCAMGILDRKLTADSSASHSAARDLGTLGSLGHFLKGSSATLGLIKVRDGCEKIQRYGKNENLDGSPENDDDLCLKRTAEALRAVKKDFLDIEKKLRKYYEEKMSA